MVETRQKLSLRRLESRFCPETSTSKHAVQEFHLRSEVWPLWLGSGALRKVERQMLVVTESHQNDQYGAVSNQLENAGRGRGVSDM